MFAHRENARSVPWGTWMAHVITFSKPHAGALRSSCG